MTQQSKRDHTNFDLVTLEIRDGYEILPEKERDRDGRYPDERYYALQSIQK